MFQIFDERGGGLVGVAALATDGGGQAAVMIPAHVEELDAAHIALGETACEQAVCGEGAGLFDIGAVAVENVLRLFGGVREIGDAHLHTKCHFILGDTSGGFGIAEGFEVTLIERGDFIEHLAAHGTVHTGGIGEVENRVA